MFPKKFKNVSTKQVSVSGATFKAWLFLSVFNFACKDSQVTKDSQAPSYMWQSSWIHHAWKLVRFCVKPVFFLIISKCATFIESSFVFLCYFLLSSLLEGCYHYLVFMDPVNSYSTSKLLLKEQVSLKSKTVTVYPQVNLSARTCMWNHFTCTKISARKY